MAKMKSRPRQAYLLFLALLAATLLLAWPAAALAAGTWSTQASATANNLRGVSFTDQSHGWAVGWNGTIVATANGGATWTPQTSGTSNNLYSVSFTDQSHGWAAGYGGTILATTDGGATWNSQTSGTANDLLAVSFTDQSHGWAVGWNGTIVATANGGATWNPQTSGTGISLNGVSFVDQSHGWAVGYGGTILATTNGGATWSPQASGTSNWLYSVSFTDQNHGWAVGGSGTILATTSGGTTWSLQTSGTANNLHGVSFTDSSHGWAVGMHSIILATTSGATWSPQASGTTNWLYGASFTDPSHGWAVGDGGTIVAYRTTGTTDTHWTWYDNIGGDDWVLFANPAWAPASSSYQLSVAGQAVDLSGYSGGVVPPGKSVAPKIPGLMGGPVKASRTSGSTGILSQRILWPKGGSSMEEVPGTDEGGLSSDFFWTWYDMASPGYKNWVLISNPGTASAYYMVKIAGGDPGPGSTGWVGPGQNVNLTFPGRMGGPVEVKAYTDSGMTTPANVMASQRVLSNFGSAINEVPGTPASELFYGYLWTWYDNVSAGAHDWIMIANPPGAAASIYYGILIGGNVVQVGGPIAPGGAVAPSFPGKMGGPVMVITFTDPNHITTSWAKSICSQRSVFGPSFEEVPGASRLPSSYNWTWYDMQSPGMRNWILIANPDLTLSDPPVTATVKIGGTPVGTYSIAPGNNVTPTFPGTMGGPVEVSATGGGVIASQRVLYNGYFNEVLGM